MRREKKKAVYADVILPEEFLPLTTPRIGFEYKNAVAYLKRRGIIEEDILRYNIGYCEEGDYARHIIIPSYDATGALNFFMGRRYYDVEGKPPHQKPYASMNIVGFELFINYNEPLILCEGVFDAIAIRNNAIPLFGKYPSKMLLEKMIINKVKQVTIVLDNDARNDAVKNYELIKKSVPHIEIHIVRLSGKDPSKLGFEKVHPLIRNSQEFDFTDLMSHKVGL
jgi:DNA primase